MFLTDEEMIEMTGYRQPAAQIRFLQKWRIRHVVSRNGRPKVTHDVAAEDCDKVHPDEPATHELLPLRALRKLPAEPPAFGSGVYFLWRGNELLYVGQALNVRDRVTSHIRARRGFRIAKKIPFDRCTFILCRQAQLIALEAKYILRHRPEFNELMPVDL